MIKHPLQQITIYLILSIILIIFAKYGHMIIIYLDLAYTYVNVQLASLFNSHIITPTVLKIITLTLLPLILVGLPAIVYRIIRKKTMPYATEAIWFFWLILALSNILIH